MRLSDEIDFRALDAASKVTFGAVEQRRRLSRAWHQSVERCKVWRTQNPALFDQMAAVVVAGLLECIAALLGRRRP